MKPQNVTRDQIINRSIAAMAALGIGDAAGDLGRDDAVRQRYGILTQLLPEGKSTDDTEFTVLSARALLDNWDDFTSQKVAATWRKLVLEQGGAKERGGMPLYGALWNLSQGIEPPFSGRDNVFNVDDGAAMRAVPFGIAAWGNPQEAARLAAIDASVSHDRDGIWASKAIAASISVALNGASVEEVINAGIAQIPDDSWLGRRLEKTLAMLAPSDSAVWEVWHDLHTELWTPKHSSAPEAIPQVYALYKMAGGDFRKGFVLSANFGRDADTICALTLALCAAGQGLDVIPNDWIEQVRYPSGVCLPFAAQEDIVKLGKELAERAL
ncbi:MAG: ADP-ribosylglycohydrolase family protein, partial [Spirochaetes bacterium]|nr:ADP-ribosylglycohydrolase family protein [Spirochaetota bacterium]